VWGTYKVLFAPPEKKRSWPARLGVFLLSVYALAVFLFLINLCLWEELCTRFAVLAGLAGVVLGVALGWWLAGLRQKSRPGWRRRAAFAVPLAILCLSIAAPFAGLVGSALTPWTWETRERTEWPARLPSWVRWAPANVVVWALPGRMEAILIKNLAPPALAREQAYRPSQPNLGGSAWVCWARQDPHAALAAALAVGPTDTPALPVTPWDYEAGYVLGAYGDERDVLERLNGPFSDQLANGLGYGLCKKHRTGMGVAVAARFERSASPVPCFGLLRYLFQCDRGRLKGMMMGYVKDPRPLSIARLDAASCYLLDLDKDHQLRVYMLGSANLDVRKIALKVSMWDAEADLRWIRPVLQAAEGRLPNSDADEQRLAAECLQWMLGRKFERLFVSKIQAGAPVLPLKPDERSDLQKLCALAREKLGLPPAKLPGEDSSGEPEPQGRDAERTNHH
jgi:hypothetical protein